MPVDDVLHLSVEVVDESNGTSTTSSGAIIVGIYTVQLVSQVVVLLEIHNRKKMERKKCYNSILKSIQEHVVLFSAQITSPQISRVADGSTITHWCTLILCA